MLFGTWTHPMSPRKHGWGAHQHNLVNTIEPCKCGSDAAFLANYFDHLLTSAIIKDWSEYYITAWKLSINEQDYQYGTRHTGNGIGYINKLRQVWLVLRWVTIHGCTILAYNQMFRPTQPPTHSGMGNKYQPSGSGSAPAEMVTADLASRRPRVTDLLVYSPWAQWFTEGIWAAPHVHPARSTALYALFYKYKHCTRIPSIQPSYYCLLCRWRTAHLPPSTRRSVTMSTSSLASSRWPSWWGRHTTDCPKRFFVMTPCKCTSQTQVFFNQASLRELFCAGLSSGTRTTGEVPYTLELESDLKFCIPLDTK